MKFYGLTAGAAIALVAVGCGGESGPEGEAALPAPDAQLAMASTAGLTHRPAEAGPITVYKTPT